MLQGLYTLQVHYLNFLFTAQYPLICSRYTWDWVDFFGNFFRVVLSQITTLSELVMSRRAAGRPSGAAN